MGAGRYRPRQRGHMWYLPRASRSCHYLFRPPVEGTPKLGLVPAAVVAASKIVPLTGPGKLGPSWQEVRWSWCPTHPGTVAAQAPAQWQVPRLGS